MVNEGPSGSRGFRRVIIGPDHPYVAAAADGRARSGSGTERRVRLPGPSLRGGGGPGRSGPFAALRHLRRGRAQHGGPGRGGRVGRPGRRIGRGSAPAVAGRSTGWRDEVQSTTRSCTIARCRRRSRSSPAWSDRSGAELGRLPARSAHPDLRRHPHLRRRPGRPRPVRGHRRRHRRAELQRQPAHPDPAIGPSHAEDVAQHPAGEPTGPAPGGHDVRPSGR